ncbi:chemotaxis response regulator protein-glutamate methylesterase [Halobellus salinus]|uniref:Protein-glutamate methylesterase/protein-glutamine glutaminase n=1 Tax=Halobellus salinus TaxID=931585 RepID=A0A830E9T1_9EURY|nr:chemotaxis-specific protein-glutamate methyltransferase CheB [Halobellus salinus]GGJ04337.1 chemotaxis response regulator protein-glutamate methylesterase [Halobellus salinus]SMP08702.1 two-component system, chemotaxis family, response regulator CheB [Halobellus salinus]
MSTAAGPGDGSGTTRAVVVDDSRFMRTLIRGLLEDGGIEVVGEASDGSAALDAVIEHDPDVVTMDIEMPSMNGIDAVEEIMGERPTPVLMLSAHAEENADVTFEALDRGAVDFVTKPGGEVTSSMPRVKRELVAKVESAARADLSATTRLSSAASDNGGTAAAAAGAEGATTAGGSGAARRSSRAGRRSDNATGAAEASPAGHAAAAYPDVGTLVVGASTGGPNVVERVLTDLPREANLRVLVVQHMPEGFTERFATRLDGRSDYDIREAESGERLEPGAVRVAPGDYHLVTTSDRNGRLRLDLTETEPVHGVRPAIDITMASAVETVEGPLCAVLLTGMGRDGVDGVGRVARNGGHTVAQDEETSAIFGMPRRAIESGRVDTVAPAEGIAESALAYFAEE